MPWFFFFAIFFLVFPPSPRSDRDRGKIFFLLGSKDYGQIVSAVRQRCHALLKVTEILEKQKDNFGCNQQVCRERSVYVAR